MKILVADDNLDSQLFLTMSLSSAGHEPVITGDGLAAYEILANPDAPQIAILDWMMPRMDGVEVCRKIRAIPTIAPVYIIMLTSRTEKENVIYGLKAGANDYIAKPCHHEELRARIGVGCRIVELQSSLVGQITELKSLRTALNQSVDGFAVTDLDGNIQFVNATWGIMHGYPVSELIGKHLSTAHPDEQWYRKVIPFNEQAAKQDCLIGEVTHVRKDGSTFPALMTSSVFSDANKKPVGIVFTAHDITERKRMEEEIIKISTLEKQGMARDLHDGLAQQLAGAAYLCHVLKDQMTSAPQKKAMKEIDTGLHQCLQHIRHVANGLLPVGLEKTGIAAALQRLAEMVSSMFPVKCRLEQSGVPVAFNLQTSTHLYYLIQEAVMNAARHGKPRNIVISLSYDPEQVTVQDDGTGFDLLQTGKGGMGLQIMRYRADIIGGVLTIDSHKGGGTRIQCDFPVLRPPAIRDMIGNVQDATGG